MSLFSDREVEQLVFPFLFPDGVNGYRTARDPSTSTLDYFQTRLLSSDPRWAAHVPYPFWACNLMEQHRLHDNISVALRTRSSGGRARRGPVVNRLTAGQLREVSDNPELSENCYAFLHNMRGSSAYWQRAKLDLFAMFRTLGPPTFFITLSADYMNWPDLLTILAKQAGMEVTEETIAQLSTEQKRVVVQQPCHYCSALQPSLPKLRQHILKGSESPIGEVVDYFWRIEFQLRCSPHVHSLWWVKDAPNLQTVGLCATPDFIDRYITTRVPSGDSCNDELR